MHPITLLAFQEELEKLSVSDEWLAQKAYSGARKRSKKNQENRFNLKSGVKEKETLLKNQKMRPLSGGKTPKDLEADLKNLETGLRHSDRRNRIRAHTLKGSEDGIGDAVRAYKAKGMGQPSPKTKGLSRSTKVLAGLSAAGLLAIGGKKLYDHVKAKKNKKTSLEKSAFDVMHAAAKEGIELAKKLKAKNLVPKAGNTLKDYMGHMDLSAHPKFSAGVKATVQGGMKKAAFTLAQLPIAGGALGAATGAAYGLARPGKDAQGKQKSRLKSAVRKGAIGAGIGAVGLPVGVIGGMAGAEALSKLGSSSNAKKKAASAAAELGGLGILAAPSIAHLRGKDWSEKNKARAEVAGLGVLAAPTAISAGKAGIGKLKGLLAKMPKHAGVPKGLKHLADSALDTAGSLSHAQEFAHFRRAAHLAGKEGPIARRAGQRFKQEALSAKKPIEKTDITSVNRKVNLRGNGFRVGELDSDRNYAKFHKSKKKEAAPSASAMMNMHRLADSAKAMKNVAKPAAQAVKLPSQASQAVRASHLSNHMAQGGHAWNPAAQAKRAIPL